MTLKSHSCLFDNYHITFHTHIHETWVRDTYVSDENMAESYTIFSFHKWHFSVVSYSCPTSMTMSLFVTIFHDNYCPWLYNPVSYFLKSERSTIKWMAKKSNIDSLLEGRRSDVRISCVDNYIHSLESSFS